jgi:hypothetical protein
MTKRKRTNNDPQNIHIKNKNGVTGTPLKTGGELGCSGRVGSALDIFQSMAPPINQYNFNVLYLRF